MGNENDLYMTIDVLHNLNEIKNHIKKFGITPQFLHLVDDNKQLSNSLKISLEDTNVIIAEEAIKETITKVYRSIQDRLERIKEARVAFYQKVITCMIDSKKQLELAEHIINKLPSNFGKLDKYIKGLDKEVNYYKYKEFKDLISQIEKDCHVKVPSIKGTEKSIKPLEFKSLLILGYNYEVKNPSKVDEDSKVYLWKTFNLIRHTSNLTKEKGTFKELGWNIDNMRTTIKDMHLLLSLVEKYKQFSSKLDEDLLIVLEKKFPKGYNDNAYSDDDTTITNLTIYYDNVNNSIKRIVENIPRIVNSYLVFLIRSLTEFR